MPDAPAQFNVDYVAQLARLQLTPEEASQFGAQLAQVLAYVDQLRAVDVTGIEPTAHPFTLVNVARADEVKASLAHDEAMRNAPAQANGLFVVPKIVE
jgi:aspartyl-tRNA(Asn)/glutamyl-tRNA(Gln) amidotransferase subunit C